MEYPETLKRVDEYIFSRDINAIPIKSLALFDNPIDLDKIREQIPSFMPPQMYFILDNHPKLKLLLEEQSLNKKLFVNNHERIYYDNLAVSVSELKKTEDFKKLDLLHENNNNFNNIKY